MIASEVLLAIAGRGRHIDGLRNHLPELLSFEGAVVEGARKPKAELHQGLFTGAVAAVHAPHLGNRDVALIDDQEPVLGEVLDERRRWLARRTPGEVPRVVLNPLAAAEFFDHVEIEEGALLESLCLNELPALP